MLAPFKEEPLVGRPRWLGLPVLIVRAFFDWLVGSGATEALSDRGRTRRHPKPYPATSANRRFANKSASWASAVASNCTFT